MDTINCSSQEDLVSSIFPKGSAVSDYDEKPTSAGSSNLKQQHARKTTAHQKHEVVDIDQKLICKICHDEFTYRELNKHKKTERHRLARRNKEEKKEKPQVFSRSLGSIKPNQNKSAKEKYCIRRDVTLPEQTQHYQNTLATFLAVRFSLSNDHKDLKFSMNNDLWGKFGDVVIEVTTSQKTKIHAIQCKKILRRDDISIASLTEEIGTFSIKYQCEILSQLRKRKNYDITYFKLFTVSNLITDNSLQFTYNDDVIHKWKKNFSEEKWKEKKAKIEEWKGRKVKIEICKKKCLINTTDDPDNICKVEILNHDDENLDKDLHKFNLYTNQKKTTPLKHLIRTMIEDKFDIQRDISHDVVRYVSEYFQTNKIYRYKYKMIKRDILLKIAELILAPHMLFLEATTEAKSIKIWDNTIQKFDLTVIKYHPDILNKIYSSINYLLKTKICSNVDTSIKSSKIDKDSVQDEAIKSEMFDGFSANCREVSLKYLYITLWKTEMAPLILTVDNETNLPLIFTIINFLKMENISLKFILMTNLKFHHSYFPENLEMFTNLEDLKKSDNTFFEQILKEIKIPIFEYNVSLKEIVDLNMDFLTKVTPDALLNMSLGQFSFKNISVPITNDIIDNTLVFTDEMLEQFKNDLEKNNETSTLSYLVNINGCPRRIEIPPDI